ncbi:MAG: hypothetical protein WBX38_02485, partial [Candidatus Sulfotelmatobacter sp.]
SKSIMGTSCFLRLASYFLCDPQSWLSTSFAKPSPGSARLSKALVVVALRDKNQGFRKKFRNCVLLFVFPKREPRLDLGDPIVG